MQAAHHGKTSSVKSIAADDATPVTTLEFEDETDLDYDDVGANTWIEPSYSILLGESRYDYAIQDGGNIIIKDDGDPLNPPSNRIMGNIFDDPVASTGSEKNPVYWEDQYPTYDGDAFTGSQPVPQGMFRLVGRFWETGKTFKATLTANYSGQSASIDIEVKKPQTLGESNSKSKDVFNQPLSIDSLCITLGGSIGIPPQMLKGHIQHEAPLANFGFAPPYRYEPFTTQQEIERQQSKWKKNLFWVTNTNMGSGGAVPSHNNLLYMSYPTSPQTVWNMVNNYSQLTHATPPGRIYLCSTTY